MKVARQNKHPFHGRFYIFDDRKLIYLSVPKAACSSIKITMAGVYPKTMARINEIMQYPYYKERREHTARYGGIHDARTWERSDIQVTRGTIPDKKQSYFKMTFVRSPFTRLVSCYRNKIVNTDLMEKNYERLGLPLFKHKMPFENFVDAIVNLPDEFTGGHFRRQSGLIYPPGRKLLFDFIGRFENLADDWRYIAKRFDLNPELVHHNASISREGATGKEDYRTYYTSVEVVDKVYEHYRDDIRLFGYEKQYQNLRAYVAEKQIKIYL